MTAPVPVPDNARVEYAVACDRGYSLTASQRQHAQQLADALEHPHALSRTPHHGCGSHRVVQRTVTPWEDVPDA